MSDNTSFLSLPCLRPEPCKSSEVPRSHLGDIEKGEEKQQVEQDVNTKKANISPTIVVIEAQEGQILVAALIATELTIVGSLRIEQVPCDAGKCAGVLAASLVGGGRKRIDFTRSTGDGHSVKCFADKAANDIGGR